MSARALALAAAFALAGCPFHPRAPVPTTVEGEWGRIRDESTRRFQLYDRLDNRANATVTHLSLAVREARARRLAKWLDWTPEELERRLADERAAAAKAEEFLVSFYTADPRANDLDAPKSVWRIALRLNGEELLANHITSVDMDATLLGLFPYVGPFDIAYLVTCPRAPGGDIADKPFVLEVTSALGKMPLDWGVEDGRMAHEPLQPVP